MTFNFRIVQSGAVGWLIGAVVGSLVPSIGPVMGVVIGCSLGVLSEHFDLLKKARNQPLQTTQAACNQIFRTSYGRMALKGCIATCTNPLDSIPEEQEALLDESLATVSESVAVVNEPAMVASSEFDDYVLLSSLGEETLSYKL